MKKMNPTLKVYLIIFVSAFASNILMQLVLHKGREWSGRDMVLFVLCHVAVLVVMMLCHRIYVRLFGPKNRASINK